MSPKLVLRAALILVSALTATAGFTPAQAQSPSIGITWEVKSRFRLFKDETSFLYLAKFYNKNGILASELALAADTKGKGWARQIVDQLCIDDDGQLKEFCTRDYSSNEPADRESVREDYLAPTDHRIGIKAEGAPAGAQCTWKFLTDNNDATAIVNKDRPCSEEVFDRAAFGKTTLIQLFLSTNPDTPAATANVAVRDILIAGLGDSTAAGEGNPDSPVALADDGFCFNRFFAGGDAGSYFRPNRAGYTGNRSCVDTNNPADAPNWAKGRAHWMNGACHRSLYSYQLRVALALAIENPRIAITYLPLGCTGATINAGLFGRQEAREIDCDLGTGRTPCSRWVNGQVDSLTKLLARARRHDADRNLDLILLTVGANDIGFSGLVANVMIDHGTKEFRIFNAAHQVSTVRNAQQALADTLPGEFANLRPALRRILGGKLERVVFVGYGHPAMNNDGEPCPASRQGFDIHPAFKIDADLLKDTSEFVTNKFFVRLKSLATCDEHGGCQAPDQDRMTFVDDHQTRFMHHGFCAQADTDPAFDRDCFKSGTSFRTDPNKAQADPLVCPNPASSFRAYAPRQRWIRTANDSYFAAMTYPTGEARYLQPADIHDPIWGAASAVYGGAMHPTAQGYAAMADAALPAARQLLALPTPP